MIAIEDRGTLAMGRAAPFAVRERVMEDDMSDRTEFILALLLFAMIGGAGLAAGWFFDDLVVFVSRGE